MMVGNNVRFIHHSQCERYQDILIVNMHNSSVLPMLLLEHMLLMFTWVVQLAYT